MITAFVSAMLFNQVSCGAAEDKFTELPGFDKPMLTDSYSGYLQVNENKALHYVFIESMSDPANDPVLIWFNGGPGCSSLLGFLQENGPVVVDDDDRTQYFNPHPWNQKASTLFLESPAGVGFSWAKDEAAMTHSDMS